MCLMQRIGFTEVELVQKVIDGVCKLIEMEEQLVAKAKVGIGIHHDVMMMIGCMHMIIIGCMYMTIIGCMYMTIIRCMYMQPVM
jgi:hypothetical protein